MIALLFSAAIVLLVLGLVYGLGSLFFAWWDGGLLRRAVMAFCVLALLAALAFCLRARHPHGERGYRHLRDDVSRSGKYL